MMSRAFIFLLFVALFSCNENERSQDKKIIDTVAADSGKISLHFVKHIQKDTTILISNVPVDILIPSLHKADLLVLPGWNYSRKQAFGAAPVMQVLLAKGYRLIIPEMGKSVYATNYFPETRNDWRKYPTLTWVTDTMIPSLQNEYGILHEEGKNYIAGISTGARGAVLIAAKKPIFTAGAALSGDYDQAQMPDDNLMRGVYGEYAQFKERWETLDNPSMQVDKIKTPFYLGHGKKDKVVPAEQTMYYYDRLHAAQRELKVMLSIRENAGHDAVYWLTEMEPVLRFFDDCGM